MAEPLRKDNQLTTADLAGRKQEARPAPGEVREIDEPNRPRLVKHENAVERTEHKLANAAERPEQKIGNAAERAEQRIAGAPGAGPQNVNTPSALFSERDIGDLAKFFREHMGQNFS